MGDRKAASGSAAKKQTKKAKSSAQEKTAKAAAQEKKAPKKTSNGKAPAKNGVSKAASKSSSSAAIVPYCVIAVLAFAAGVLSPPIMSYLRANPTVIPAPIRKLILAGDSPVNYALCDEAALSHFLHEDPVPGLHVACVEPGDKSLTFNVYEGAQVLTPAARPRKITVSPTGRRSEVTWSGVRKALYNSLELPASVDIQLPWAIYTPQGERIVSEDDEAAVDLEQSKIVIDKMVDSGMILIYEGGNWLWPGVRVGFKRSVDLYSIMPEESEPVDESEQKEKRTVTLETVNLEPLVFSVEGFLSEDECNHVQKIASPLMKYSEVVLMDHDAGRPATDFRTSQTTFLGGDDDTLVDLERRTASLVRIPRDHQEELQVLRYGLGEHYDVHHDFFDPQLYKNDARTLRMIQHGRRNRMITVFWYLSDVEEGGETAFPRAGAYAEDKNHCEEGLRVKPQRGKVIIFYSLTADGKLDPLSSHAACPVKFGTKWAANKWVWSSPMSDAYGDDDYDEEYYDNGDDYDEDGDEDDDEGDDEDEDWEDADE